MKTYFAVFFGSTFFALVITPLVIWLARRIKAIDAPSVRKVHSNPVPRIGGVAIFTSTMLIVLPVLFLQNRIGDAFRQISGERYNFAGRRHIHISVLGWLTMLGVCGRV